MRKQYKRWLARLLMALQIFSMPSCAFGDWLTVPKGWIAPTEGVFGDIETARDTAAALQSWRLEAGIWKTAASQMQDEVSRLNERTEKRLKQLEFNLEQERQAWKTEQKRQRQNTVLMILVVAIIGGVVGHNL